MLDRIYISEIQTDLRYNDRRSAVSWCRRMGVQLFKDKGCRISYAIKEEYEAIKNYQMTEYLKQKYGTNNLKNEQKEKTEIFNQMNNSKEQNKLQYIPQYENEKRMLSIFTNL